MRVASRPHYHHVARRERQQILGTVSELPLGHSFRFVCAWFSSNGSLSTRLLILRYIGDPDAIIDHVTCDLPLKSPYRNQLLTRNSLFQAEHLQATDTALPLLATATDATSPPRFTGTAQPSDLLPNCPHCPSASSAYHRPTWLTTAFNRPDHSLLGLYPLSTCPLGPHQPLASPSGLLTPPQWPTFCLIGPLAHPLVLAAPAWPTLGPLTTSSCTPPAFAWFVTPLKYQGNTSLLDGGRFRAHSPEPHSLTLGTTWFSRPQAGPALPLSGPFWLPLASARLLLTSPCFPRSHHDPQHGSSWPSARFVMTSAQPLQSTVLLCPPETMFIQKAQVWTTFQFALAPVSPLTAHPQDHRPWSLQP